jgi:hypothetical protein
MTFASVAALALFMTSLAASQDTPVRARPETTSVIAVAPADVQWTRVKAEDWKSESPNLAGKYVEFSGGGMFTLLIVDRTSSFNNTGWLIDADGRTVGTV